tara:strand:+ start:33 stop:251 length:219 start_codon:yes stop_codon:yes gene_type:complete
MGKVKAWAYDCAEQEVDSILEKLKQGVIKTKDDAVSKIMQVSNLDILGVDEYNVDEVIDDYLNDNKVGYAYA